MLKLFVLSFWKPFLWVILVSLGSAMSGKSVSKIKFFHIPYFDKIVHFGMYFLLTFLLLQSFLKWTQEKNQLSHKFYILSLFISIFYGGILEILQGIFFVHRSCDVSDLLANSLGAFAATLAFDFRKKICK